MSGVWRDLARTCASIRRDLRDLEDVASALESMDYEIHGRPGDRVVGYIRPGFLLTETYYFVFCTDIASNLVIVPVEEEEPADSGWLHHLWDHMGAHTAVERLRERAEGET